MNIADLIENETFESIEEAEEFLAECGILNEEI
jgi:hypothetical protein